MIHDKALWHDRKRNVLGLPWTFTVYEMTPDKLYVTTGFLNKRDDECRLYRITDMTLTRSLWQRITRTGTIHCDSADKTLGNFDLINIRDAVLVKEKLSDLVEEARHRNRVYARETVDTHGHGPGPGPDGPNGPDLEDEPDHDHFDHLDDIDEHDDNH